MNDSLKELMNKIKTEYGNDAYVGISGDRGIDYASPKLRELWGAFPEFSILTIDRYYNRIFADDYPDYTAKEFEEDALNLLDALTHEFELINKANN